MACEAEVDKFRHAVLDFVGKTYDIPELIEMIKSTMTTDSCLQFLQSVKKDTKNLSVDPSLVKLWLPRLRNDESFIHILVIDYFENKGGLADLLCDDLMQHCRFQQALLQITKEHLDEAEQTLLETLLPKETFHQLLSTGIQKKLDDVGLLKLGKKLLADEKFRSATLKLGESSKDTDDDEDLIDFGKKLLTLDEFRQALLNAVRDSIESECT